MKVEIHYISEEKAEKAELYLYADNQKKEEFEFYLRMNGIIRRTIAVSEEGKIRYLCCDKINYIEAEQNIRIIHTQEKAYRSSSRLYELEDQLPWYFIRVSKSVILNVNAVKQYNPLPNGLMMAELNQGGSVYISRKYLKPLLEKIELRRR